MFVAHLSSHASNNTSHYEVVKINELNELTWLRFKKVMMLLQVILNLPSSQDW